MRISFVVPAHNEEQRLPACLQSILSQPPELVGEVIVVDNGSTDRTAELAQSFGSPVRVIHQPIPGLPPTRQAGFAAARFELVASVDADTTLPARWAACVAEDFSRQPQLAAVSGPYDYHDLDRLSRLLNHVYESVGFVPTHALMNWLGVAGIINGGNFAVRREALASLVTFTEDIVFYGEDSYMAKRFRRYGPIKFDLRLVARSSARRLHEQGKLKTLTIYYLNWFSILLRDKPFNP